MNEPDIFKNPCPLCKKSVATRLCDYVIDYIWTTVDFMSNYETCDLPMCENCAINFGPLDFCPHHNKLQKQVELPKELKPYQLKAKAEILQNAWKG